jgi:hypothetical protein
MRRDLQTAGIGLAIAVIVAGGGAFRVSGGDALLHCVYKRQLFTQTDAGSPTPQSCGSVFCALVEASGSNSVASAQVSSTTGAGGGLTAQYEEEFLPSRWVYSLLGAFPDKEALDAAWMNGEFSFSITGASDGASAPTLHLSGDAYPANPPHIRNFNDAQAVDASKSFVLGWEGFDEGTTNDFVFVSVRKMPEETTVFNTPFLEETGRLDGTATVVSIPAGTLKPGSEYYCYVRFDKVISRTGSGTGGGAGVASYSKGTHFVLKTR